MERVLVTGANGYIGRKVVDALLALGYKVTATDFKCDQINKKADCVEIDLFNNNANLYELFLKPDRLIHLAWKDGFNHNASSHIEFLPKHFAFVKSLIDAGVKNIAVMGSMHEVGFYEGEVNENTACNPLSLYGISKNALRQSLMVLNKNNDFNLYWLRGYYIFGNDEKNHSIFTKLLEKEAQGEKLFPFTTGENQYDFISIDNLALEIALASVQDEVKGIINVCSGKPISLKDMVESFIKENDLKIRLNYGVFPSRPYDSKIIYGDSSKIKQIVKNSKNKELTKDLERMLG
ncbi:MAG: NAD(P)-dependent oxidoreductase [Bacilli bacterium]|nr:NAD(P)-dependent oxidoreductase [Bacilli bacterium]